VAVYIDCLCLSLVPYVDFVVVFVTISMPFRLIGLFVGMYVVYMFASDSILHYGVCLLLMIAFLCVFARLPILDLYVLM